MPPTPKKSLDASYLEGLQCPICGRDELVLKAMDRYPDYVTCRSCESQFVVEDGGERVMYGKIPPSYPRTQRFALQQWAWPEAIARRASQERPEPPGVAPLEEPAGDHERTPPPEDAAAPLAEDVEPQPEAPLAEPSGLAEDSLESAAAPGDQPLASLEGKVDAETPAGAEIDGPDAEPGEDLTDFAPAEETATDTEEFEDPWPAGDAEPEFELGEEGESAPAVDEEFEELADGPFPWEEPPDQPPDEEEVQPFTGVDDPTDSPEDLWEQEPAPEMPDWLLGEENEAAGRSAGEPKPSSDAFQEQPVDREIDPDQEFGEGEDLLASLWAEEDSLDEGEASEPKSPGAGPAGSGALAFEADQDSEGQLPDEGELAEWPETDQQPTASGRTEEQDRPSGSEPIEPGPAADTPPDPGKLQDEELAEMYWTGEIAEEEPEEPAPVAPPEIEGREPEEPPPGVRHRVVLERSTAKFPQELCGHCARTPTAGTLAVTARIFQGAGLGERQLKTYRIPLCADCQQRANARSEDQQNARLQAHLISVLMALILVVGALAFGLVDFQGSAVLNLAILGLLVVMGYAVPVTFLLIRASRYPKPPDATFVETTLQVPADTEGTETAFEWRNRTYARHFHAANEEVAMSGVNKIQERQYEGP